MNLWTDDVNDAVTMLCGGDSALNGMGLDGAAERIAGEEGRTTPREIAGWASLEGWRVHAPEVCAAYADCVFERFAQKSQFDRLRDWHGGGIVALALDGSGFHGQQGRRWQCCEGNMYVSLALPAAMDVGRVREVMDLPSLSVIAALSPLMRVVPEMKQPNDVVVWENGEIRKLAGCLTEVAVAGELITQVRYGIGIDLWQAPALEDADHLRACCVRAFLREGLADRGWAELYREVLFSMIAKISCGVARLSDVSCGGAES